jgi:transcriptional regulator with XRE-family HTH domain
MKMREFGARLVQARAQGKLSVSELARRSHIDYMQISRYEKGESLPSLDSAVRLATVLGMRLDVLAGREEPPPPPPPPAFRSSSLFDRMRELDQLAPDRQELAIQMLDAVLAGELDALAARLRRS